MLVLSEDRAQVLKRMVKDGTIKILYFDIETSPMTVETFYIGNKVHIYPEQIQDETKIITIQYMYEGDTEPCYLEWEKTKDGWDDSAMIEEFITNVLNDSNTIVIGQNHKDFDHRTLLWRANVLNLTPPRVDIINLDTLKLAKTAFRAPSYKLDYRSKKYGLGGKIKMEMQDWIDVKHGDRQKLKKMIEYGCKDITDLRSLFWKELPYYTKLPAPLEKLLGTAQVYCPNCEARRQKKFDVERVKVKNKNMYKCNNCQNTWI